MSPSVSQLIAALPEAADAASAAEVAALPEAIARMSLRPIPIGRFRRLTVLGTLQAKIDPQPIFEEEIQATGWDRDECT